MKSFKILLVLTLMLFLTSCSEKKEEIHWDRDMCARCKMVVSDRKNTVKLQLLNSKKYLVFDDVGCYIFWRRDNPDVKAEYIIINDSQSGKWIDMKKAFYTAGNFTPMGYGYWAYERGTEPKKRKIYTFDEIVKPILKRGR